MKAINTPFAPQAIGPYVQANQHGNIIYTSGQIPLTKDGVLAGEDIKTQTHQVMKTRLIKTTCFLSDLNNFAASNEVYASYFERNLPARSCVEVARLPRDVLVEVEVIAVIPL